MTNMIVTAALPQGGLVTRIGDGGTLADNSAIVWAIEQLPATTAVYRRVHRHRLSRPARQFLFRRLQRRLINGQIRRCLDPVVTFIGDGVPVWALQGAQATGRLMWHAQ